MRKDTPYATLALLYDALLGDPFFSQLRRVFEWLVRRYGIRIGSAADVSCGTEIFVWFPCERGVPLVYGVDSSPEMLGIAVRKNQATVPDSFFRTLPPCDSRS